MAVIYDDDDEWTDFNVLTSDEHHMNAIKIKMKRQKKTPPQINIQCAKLKWKPWHYSGKKLIFRVSSCVYLSLRRAQSCVYDDRIFITHVKRFKYYHYLILCKLWTPNNVNIHWSFKSKRSKRFNWSEKKNCPNSQSPQDPWQKRASTKQSTIHMYFTMSSLARPFFFLCCLLTSHSVIY